MVAMYNAGAKLACNIAWGRYAGFAKREQKVETQIACRTGWVTAGPAEQLLKCGGRGGGGIGWTVSIPKKILQL